jgi:hypothetical protein
MKYPHDFFFKKIIIIVVCVTCISLVIPWASLCIDLLGEASHQSLVKQTKKKRGFLVIREVKPHSVPFWRVVCEREDKKKSTRPAVRLRQCTVSATLLAKEISPLLLS